VLAETGGGAWHPERDARAWIRFCLTAHLRQARTLSQRVEQSERLWSLLEAEVARLGLPDRTILALFDAASGFRVHNSRYQTHAEVSDYAGGRDLRRLVEAELLVPRGEKRGRFYVAHPRLLDLVGPARRRPSGMNQDDPSAAVQETLAL
jgi:hypothetical protein